MKAQLRSITPKKSYIDILKFLAKNIGKKHTQLEIAKAIGKEKSYKNVRECIKELVKDKIVAIEDIGPYVLCSLDINEQKTIDYISFIENLKKYPIFKKAPVVEEISNRLILQIKLHTVFFSMLLFGSYAKGTSHEKSDVDLIIITEKRHHANVNKEIASLQAIYTKKINAFVITKEDYEKMLLSKEGVNIGKESLKDHILLYGSEFYYQIVRDAYGKG